MGEKRGWFDRHIRDPYVQKARILNYRSRAIFKLQELQSKFEFLRQDQLVVDLGAAPGSWSEFVRRSFPTSRVVAVDLIEIDPIDGVQFINCDFSRDYGQIPNLIGKTKIDVILSDIAPNLSGNKIRDQYLSANLIELLLDFALNHLKSDGHLVCKLFQGVEFETLLGKYRLNFKKVRTEKPRSSRSESSEVYLVCKGLKG